MRNSSVSTLACLAARRKLFIRSRARVTKASRTAAAAGIDLNHFARLGIFEGEKPEGGQFLLVTIAQVEQN